jgi:spore coat protein CotH
MRWSLAVSIALLGCGSPSDGGGDGEPFCGDGQRDQGAELCDGDDLAGKSCQSLGFSIGELACREDCTLDTSDCLGEAGEFDLESAEGCEGIFNPDQVLTYHIQGGSGGGGQFRCGDGPTFEVEIETKRNGGFKIDFNEFADAQHYFGVKKLVFDDSGSGATGDIVSQYLGWRLMQLGGAVASRAALAEVTLNGSSVGLMVNIEAVDKTLLRHRFGDDDGWLYKKSGGTGDGLKTHLDDGLADANPYDDYLCFWNGGNACPVPDDVAGELPNHVAMDQAFRLGAVNALIANTDSPLFKDNNYYVYDWPGKRYFLPWDLDTLMKDQSFAMVQDTAFAAVLMAHWESDYRARAAELLADPLSLDAIEVELDRIEAVAGGDVASVVDNLRTWWRERHPVASGEL